MNALEWIPRRRMLPGAGGCGTCHGQPWSVRMECPECREAGLAARRSDEAEKREEGE